MFDQHDPIEAPEVSRDDSASVTTYRGATGDPIFGYLLGIAIAIGLIPLLPDNVDLRYTMAWAILGGVSVIVWLLGTMERIGQEKPENLLWGLGFGLILGIPFLIFGADILANATQLIFGQMTTGAILAYLLFVMPMAETLFFRGVMQAYFNGLVVSGLATGWHLILFFPVFWADVLTAPIVAMVIAVALFSMNGIYSYVRDRNGLASSWVTQIVVNLIMVFLPFLSMN